MTACVSRAMALISNPAAGSSSVAGSPVESVLTMLREDGLSIESIELDDGMDASEAARSAIRKGAQVIVAAGGDGTVSAVAVAVAESDAILGVLPTGTFNHFAKDLQIPRDLTAAARVLARGNPISIDVGEVNGHIFINNSGLGIYPRILAWRQRQQRIGRNKWIAFARAAIATFRRVPFLQVTLRTNEGKVTRVTPLVFIGNNRYETIGLDIGSRRCLDAGRLFVYFSNAKSGLDLARQALAALLPGIRPREEFETLCVPEALIETGGTRARVSLDGEIVWMETPHHYRIRPAALRVLVP